MDYWQQRFLQMENAQNDRSIKKVHEIQEQFEKAQAAIEEKLNAWYQRFARNNNVSMAEAKRMLSAKELKEFKWSVEEYIKYGEQNELGGKWRKELENASARYHISRLEAIKFHIQHEIEKLYGNCTDSIDRHIRDTYLADYYRTAFEIQRGTGIGYNFQSIDNRLISKIISKPWAVDEKNFSERLWGNKTKLINTLHNSLSRMLITGEGPDRAITEIAKEMNASRRQASTVVMTESAAFANEARRDCMKELDVEQFEVVETLDSRTCETCAGEDGGHHNMSDFQIGVNAPPFHPNCRGCVVPYFGDEFDSIGKRAARDPVTGKTITVPYDMTYQEWYDTYVKGNEDAKPTGKQYKDVLDEWLKDAKPNTHEIVKLKEYSVCGITYKVDNINVKQNNSKRELEVAELLKENFGGEIKLVPEINGKYSGVSTPDYIFKNQKWDLKELNGSGKDAVRDAIKKKYKQADNFIIDITKCKLTEKEVLKQAESVFSSDNTRFVNNLMIIRENEIIRVLKRI